MQRRDVINQRQPQLLKYVDASQANELVLIANALGYVSMLLNKTLFPDKHFSSKISGCFFISFHWFTLYLNKGSLVILAN